MGVVTYEHEVVTSISPARMFKAFVLEVDILFPKIASLAVNSIEIVEGDGGVGTIKKVTFGEGSQMKYMKHKYEGIDHESLTYQYSVIEGDALTESKLEKISYENKFVAGPNGGSILKSTCHYHITGDLDFEEEDIKFGKEKTTRVFKAVEAYLLANPDHA